MYKSNQNGSAIVLVLIISTILLLGSVWAVSVYRTGIQIASGLQDKLQSRISAESTLQILLYYGATGYFRTASMHNSLQGVVAMPDSLNISGIPNTVKIHSDNVAITLQDTAGLLNGWMLSERELMRFWEVKGLAHEEALGLAQSMSDWYDQDDFHRENGAEKWYYQTRQNYAYAPRNNRIIQSIDELSLLKGMTSEYWQTIRPFLIISHSHLRNRYTMPAEILATRLNIAVVDAEQLISLRDNQEQSLSSANIEAITGIQLNKLFDSDDSFPARIVQLHIAAVHKKAVTHWKGQISFRADLVSPWRITQWQEGS